MRIARFSQRSVHQKARPAIVILLCVLAVFLGGCPSPNQSSTTTGSGTSAKTATGTEQNATQPRWIYQNNPASPIAVVFVHGIFGDTIGTWTNPAGKTFFDFLHSAPGMSEKLDLYAFGFTSNMFADGSLDIREAANKLDQYLDYSKVWDYQTVVFVAHSMGGLVVLREMINYPKHRQQTPLLMFYAVPSEGSQITSIAQYVVNNPATKQMLMADGNDFLQQLSDDWGRIAPEERPAVVCAYEKAPVIGQMIVPWSSATRFCNDAPSAIEGATHITIVKPEHQDDPAVVALVNALNKYVRTDDSAILTPDFAPQGDHWIYTLTNSVGQNPARLINDGPRTRTAIVARVSSDKLMVVPDQSELPARHTDKLTLVLLRGQLDKSFSFVLQTPPSPDRTIEVSIPDIQAIEEQQKAVVNAAAAGVSDFLASSDTVKRLNTLPQDQQWDEVAHQATKAVNVKFPDLPQSAQAVVVADALAAAGWPQLAHAALQRTKVNPSSSVAAAAKSIGAVIATQTGKANDFSPAPAPGVPTAEIVRPILIDRTNTDTLSKLSERMQSVSALKADGLSLKGDIDLAQGKAAVAHQSYSAANAIRKSPALDLKMTKAIKVGAAQSQTGHP